MPQHNSVTPETDSKTSDRADVLPEPPRFLGRDTSWLEFNRRVLAQAQDPEAPLLERVKFLGIFASNLDEFFMKRVAMLKRRQRAGLDFAAQDGMPLRPLLDAVRATVAQMQHAQAECWTHGIRPALARAGVRVLNYTDLSDADRARVDAWFQDQVFPILTPLAVDPGHRFPFISNLSESLGVRLAQPGRSEKLFARLKIPDLIPRMTPLPRTGPVGEIVDPHDVNLLPLDQIICSNLDGVFPGLEIVSSMPFRVTRGAGLEFEGEDEAENLMEHVESELRMRRFADPVRLETHVEPDGAILELLLEELDLTGEDLYLRDGPLEYGDLAEIAALDRPDLQQPAWAPVVPPPLRDQDADIFSVIRERDVLVHHPYESFSASVERFIAAAAADPNVLAIKQTLYRTSRDSPFVESLIRAAEEGKTVACLVELRARFDEDKNVRFARQLEKHGVHVAYGVVGYKTHCKCSLVVRREHDGLRAYAHIGTGNYHPGTAQLYTDCGLLTADPALTEDVVDLFNFLTGRSLKSGYHKAVVAPVAMRRCFSELIDREADHARAGRPARILVKMNALEDPGIIERLYAASQAGVKIVCVVRGFCCLRPGVPGLSENIEVRSIIGRFLEHSRIFHFADGHEDPRDGAWFIGSADWMRRNLNNRVELIVPVADPRAKAQLHRILEVCLEDRLRSWSLNPDGSYTNLGAPEDAGPDSVEVVGSFETLCREAAAS